MFDFELGILDGKALQWYSNVDGSLGKGRHLGLSAGSLSPGIHTISLKATDGEYTVLEKVRITILADIDRDSLPDEFENQYESQNPKNPYDNGQDIDGDGLTSSQENFFNTNPEDPDTDRDGKSDGEEVTNGTDPRIHRADFDDDGDCDRDDLNYLLSFKNQPASAAPKCDIDNDGLITVLDARQCALLCTRVRCATE